MKKFLRRKQTSVPEHLNQLVAPDTDPSLATRSAPNQAPAENPIEIKTRIFRLELENRKLKERKA